MKLQINLTKEVLKESKYCKNEPGENCAIANAIRDIFPEAMIGTSKIFFKKDSKKPFDFFFNSKNETIELPLIASQFIDNFDNSSPEEREKMNPISFEIIIPESIIDEIDISEVNEILSHSKTLQLV